MQNNEPELKPQEIPLWLPSQIKSQVSCDPRLAEIEWKLRFAQAHEALETVRHNLQMRAHLYKFKDRFVRGQAANTRSRTAISNVQTRIDAAADEYRAAHLALTALALPLKKVAWNTHLLPLNNADIRHMSDADDGESEGRRMLSWIWKSVIIVEGNDDNLQDGTNLSDYDFPLSNPTN